MLLKSVPIFYYVVDVVLLVSVSFLSVSNYDKQY